MTSANEQDPVLYRLYEVLVVYGWSYKALIQEKFGDGIMSAIDFRTSLVRKPDPKGDRVVITLDGKVCWPSTQRLMVVPLLLCSRHLGQIGQEPFVVVNALKMGKRTRIRVV